MAQPSETGQPLADPKAAEVRISRSSEVLRESADVQADSADRRTILAADRTLLAAERTYAAWVRTGLTALAAGVGARALLHDLVPAWMASATATLLVLFSAFCFVAAVWREMLPGISPLHPDTRRLPAALLIVVNGFLVLVAAAALVGIWTK